MYYKDGATETDIVFMNNTTVYYSILDAVKNLCCDKHECSTCPLNRNVELNGKVIAMCHNAFCIERPYDIAKALGLSVLNLGLHRADNEQAAAMFAHVKHLEFVPSRSGSTKDIAKVKFGESKVLTLSQIADCFNAGQTHIWVTDLRKENTCIAAVIAKVHGLGYCAIYAPDFVEYPEEDYGKTWLAYKEKPI